MKRSRLTHFFLLSTLILSGFYAAFLRKPLREDSARSELSASTINPRQHSPDIDSSTAQHALRTTKDWFFLGGVVADDSLGQRYAIIGTPDGNNSLYRVGDLIQEGVSVHAISSHRVLLDFNGQVQQLLLADSASIELPTLLSQIPSARDIFSHPSQRAYTPAPGYLRDAIQYSEVNASGHLRAIRVLPGPDMMAFQRLGLVPGDTILAVDGISVEEQESGERALHDLVNSQTGRLTIVRNGNRQDLFIHRKDWPN